MAVPSSGQDTELAPVVPPCEDRAGGEGFGGHSPRRSKTPDLDQHPGADVGFFRALLIGLPLSALLWAGIIYAIWRWWHA